MRKAGLFAEQAHIVGQASAMPSESCCGAEASTVDASGRGRARDNSEKHAAVAERVAAARAVRSRYSRAMARSSAHGVAGARWSILPFFRAGQALPGVVFGAPSLGVLNDLGFDGISTLSEEARDGRRSVAIATLLSLLLSACLFIGEGYLASLFVLGKTAFSPGLQTYAAILAPGLQSELGIRMVVVRVYAKRT